MNHLRQLATLVFWVIFFVLSFSSISHSEFHKTKIAVLDFESHGKEFDIEKMGTIVAEWFTTSLVKNGRFEVVERAMLKKIIAEQKLGTTGIIDDNSASQLGKILGVKIIVTGSVLHLDNVIEINSRIIGVENGSIIAAENIKCATSSDLQKTIERLTTRIVKNFPLTGYIVKKNEKSVIIDLGYGAGLKKNMEFIVFKEGAIIKHPTTGEVLDVEHVNTGKLKITHVRSNISVAEIISEIGDGIQYGQLVKSTHVKKTNPQFEYKSQSLGKGWHLTEKNNSDIPNGMVKLNVVVIPQESRIRILNIKPQYKPGIILAGGSYHIEVSKPDFQTTKKWVNLRLGNTAVCSVSLKATTSKESPTVAIEKKIKINTHADSVGSRLLKEISSNDPSVVINAAKRIINEGTAVANNHIFEAVKTQLLEGYNKDRGRDHTDSMAWLCKALAVSHNPKYQNTLETVRDDSGSFKLTIYATKALFSL